MIFVVLFSPETSWQFEKAFPSKNGLESAFFRSLKWAVSFCAQNANAKIALFCSKKNEAVVCENATSFFKNCGAQQNLKNFSIVAQENWRTSFLLETMSALTKNDKQNCDAQSTIIFANVAAAFLDLPLSKRLFQLHTDYKAEYTFADGYPAGFAPEILDAGAAAILAALCKTVAKNAGDAFVSKDAIFDVIKSDINSFEIETEIASRDFRLLRMNFICENKLNFLSAKNLAEKIFALKKSFLLEIDEKKIGEENVIEIANLASESDTVLKTVPAFYNIQINCSCKNIPAFSPYAKFFEKRFGENVLQTQKCMAFEKFSSLMKNVRAFSNEGVVSLSLFGEAVLHPEIELFVEEVLNAGFFVLIEIDGGVIKDFVQSKKFFKIFEIVMRFEKNCNNENLNQVALKKIIFIVLLDAFEQKTFSLFHGDANLTEAIDSIKKMHDAFSETYVQFTRTTQNEDELENFFRAWSDKESASGGKLIIQKYDNFCGALPFVKTADLAPVEREPCWHLRRDAEILFDGSFPLCREVCVPNFDERNFLGNVFETEIEKIWQKKNFALKEQIQKKYCGSCERCDEYYVFNF